MVNPGAFHGKRKEFLLAEREGYAQAVKEDRATEQLTDIIHRFLKRFPISMPDEVEPTDSELERVNDAAPDIELPVPDESALSAEEYAKAMKDFQSEGEKLTFRQQQIRRWLRYQYSKMHKLSAKETGQENPYTPHKAQAFALWAKVNAVDVQQAWEKELEKKPLAGGERAAKLNTFKSKLFKKESKEVQQEWVATAEEEHEEAMKEYNGKMESQVSKEPADIQQCLEHLPSVVQPFIEMIMEAMGCVVTCIVAGPQPAHRGHLHVSSFNAGKTLGNIKQNFVQVERSNYRKHVVPMFANFLNKCYTVETCRAQALTPNTPTLESIGFTSEEQGIALHAIGGDIYNNDGECIPSDDLLPTNTTGSRSDPSLPSVPKGRSMNEVIEQAPMRGPPSRGPTPPLSPHARPSSPHTDKLPSRAPSTAPTPVPLLPPSRAPSCQPTPVPPVPPSKAPSRQPTPAAPVLPSNTPSRQPTPTPPVPPSKAPSCQPTPMQPLTPSRAVSPAALSIGGQGNSLMSGADNGDEASEELGVSRSKRKAAGDTENARPKKKVKTARKESNRAGSKRTKENKTPSMRTDTDSNITKALPALPRIELPKNAPKWAIAAVATFQQEKALLEFTRLLNLWIRFEIQEEFADSSKFGASHWPQAIHDWIARGRSPTFQLQAVATGVNPVKEFEDKFWAWWATLQPKGCSQDDGFLEMDKDGLPLRVFDGDWEILRLPGANGWSSVITALCFWAWRIKGMKTEGYREKAAAERAQKSWTNALKDVEWALSHLV